MLCFCTANKRPMPPGHNIYGRRNQACRTRTSIERIAALSCLRSAGLLFIGAWRSFLVGDRGFTLNTLLLIYMAELNRKYGYNNEKAHARTSVVSRSAAWTFG